MNKHFFSGVFMLSVGLLLLLFLIPYGIDTPKKIRFAALSPTYYPQIVAVILSVIGAAIIFKNRRPLTTKGTDDADEVHPNAKMRIGSFLLLLAVYSLSLEFLGFVLSGVLALVLALYSRENVARLLSSRCLCSFQFHYFYFSTRLPMFRFPMEY